MNESKKRFEALPTETERRGAKPDVDPGADVFLEVRRARHGSYWSRKSFGKRVGFCLKSLEKREKNTAKVLAKMCNSLV